MPSSGVLGRSGGQDAQADFIRQRIFYGGWPVDDGKEQNYGGYSEIVIPLGLVAGGFYGAAALVAAIIVFRGR